MPMAMPLCLCHIGTYLDAAKWYGRLQLGGSKRCTFSETMDIRDFTVCIIRCVYRTELILGTVVYGTYRNDTIPSRYDTYRLSRYLSHDTIRIAIPGENRKMNQLITIGSLYCILCVQL